MQIWQLNFLARLLPAGLELREGVLGSIPTAAPAVGSPSLDTLLTSAAGTEGEGACGAVVEGKWKLGPASNLVDSDLAQKLEGKKLV